MLSHILLIHNKPGKGKTKTKKVLLIIMSELPGDQTENSQILLLSALERICEFCHRLSCRLRDTLIRFQQIQQTRKNNMLDTNLHPSSPGRRCAAGGNLSCTKTRITDLSTSDPPRKGQDHTHKGYVGAKCQTLLF